MHQRLNIISGHRNDRLPLLMEEIERQQITNYMLWDAIYLPTVVESISEAHKQIVRYAKLAEFGEVVIAEDDFVGTHPESWKYFLSQIPRKYDLFLSMVYTGDIDENNRVVNFTGMTLYSVHTDFYDTFLSVDPKEHIDRALGGLGDYQVCQPFTFIQRNGWSSNTGKNEVYDTLLEGRELFKG